MAQMADAYMFMKLEKNLFKLPGGAYLHRVRELRYHCCI